MRVLCEILCKLRRVRVHDKKIASVYTLCDASDLSRETVRHNRLFRTAAECLMFSGPMSLHRLQSLPAQLTSKLTITYAHHSNLPQILRQSNVLMARGGLKKRVSGVLYLQYTRTCSLTTNTRGNSMEGDGGDSCAHVGYPSRYKQCGRSISVDNPFGRWGATLAYRSVHSRHTRLCHVSLLCLIIPKAGYIHMQRYVHT